MGARKISTSLTDSIPAAEVSVQQVEAARYALLRRLSPSLRHHMVRPLQPIGLIYGVMHHKLSAEEPDLQSVRMEAEKINEFAKAALDECVNMSTWLTPEPDVLTRLDSGVREGVSLLATMLHFCGFRLVNEIENIPAQVQRDAVRMVVIGALLELTDSLDGPAILTLSASTSKGKAVVSIQVSHKGEGLVDRYEEGYRKLLWADVVALAAAEHVGLSRQDGRVSMTFDIE